MSRPTVFQLIHILSAVSDPNETVEALTVAANGAITLNGRVLAGNEDSSEINPASVGGNSADRIELWTDGACSGNPGPGGWAYCLIVNGKFATEDAGYAADTTNNRMEMQAVITGLDRLDPGLRVTVYTDSQLIVDTIQKGWKRKKNCDLWTRLDAAIARHEQVTFQHVRGHNGTHWNEHVDQLAVAQYQQYR